jgi:hypothetical protein
MKKSVFVVEGQTERIFIEKLIEVVAGGLDYSVTSFEHHGDSFIQLLSRGTATEEQAKFVIRIIDVGNDERVRSYVDDENIATFKEKGFLGVYGLRDKYTGNSREVNLDFNVARDKELSEKWELDIAVVVAVQEVEAWFLSVPSFFAAYDNSLKIEKISSILGYDIAAIQVELIPHPAQTISKVLNTVGKQYKKKEKDVFKIIHNIDYETLYVHKSQVIPALGIFCSLIDSALS